MAVSRRLATILLFSALVPAAQHNRSRNSTAVEWLPDGAVYSFEVTRPAILLDLATNLKIPRRTFTGVNARRPSPMRRDRLSFASPEAASPTRSIRPTIPCGSSTQRYPKRSMHYSSS